MILKEKMIQLGDYYRHYQYSPFKLVKTDLVKKLRTKEKSEDYDKNQFYYAEASRRALRDLVLCNLPYGNPRFLTLTYAKPQFSNTQAKYDLKLFLKRLRYHLIEKGYSPNFRYIAVPEEHDSQDTQSDRVHSYHFHIILFDLPFLSTTFYSENWKHGFIRINLIKGNHFKTAHYLTKYLSKSVNHQRGQRRYLVSRNIYRPKEVQLDSIPMLMYKKGVNYHSFTGANIRIDYYELFNLKQK